VIYLFSYFLISLTAYLIWQAIRPRYCILVDWQIRELIKKGAIAEKLQIIIASLKEANHFD
jgi:hypothetical protein